MENEISFRNYYESVYKNILNYKFNELLKDIKKKFNKMLLILIIIDLIPSLCILLVQIDLKNKLLLILIYNIILIIWNILSIKNYNKKKSYKFNEKIIKDNLKYIIG